MRASDFDYALPPELIAQHPSERRTDSRLLHLSAEGSLRDLRFSDLPSLVAPNDVIVLNDTRVIKARLVGAKDTGGRVEIMVERLLEGESALAMIRASKTPRAGSFITVGANQRVEVLGREDDLFRIRFVGIPAAEALERWGDLPLPPYITHQPDAADAERYQTVYAQHPGAVAAPTAGLHFDVAMLDRLTAQAARLARVTLHVGAGTFQPLRVENIDEHRMHRERFEVSQGTVDAIAETKAAGGRVIAVGTTSLRALESASRDGTLRATSGDTDLFVYPGFRFHTVDRLLTNFHLPKSTLLMLVSAFGGTENIRRAYQHAIAARYRFFSYGDAMLIERAA